MLLKHLGPVPVVLGLLFIGKLADEDMKQANENTKK